MSAEITPEGAERGRLHSATVTRVVERADTADAFGNPGVEVLATPRLVAWFEDAAAAALAEAGRIGSVGTRVDIHHVKPTPVGGRVVVTADLASLEGRRAEFRIVAWSGDVLIGRGTHTRFVVDSAEFTDAAGA